MIIGISGKKYSGKSTVAEMLGEELGWEITSFATKLKEVTCALSGCTMEQLEDYNFKEKVLVPTYMWPFCDGDKKPTYRNFLQYFGTNVMRKYYDNLWVDATLQRAPEDIIISDCRFLSEARQIGEYNGIVIKVLRSGTSSNDAHCSETEMEMINQDVIIENDGDLEALRCKVREFVSDLKDFKVKSVY